MKLFSLIKQGDIRPHNNKKVIPEDSFSTLLNAAEILEKAKQDSITAQREAEEEAQRLKKEAEERGFAEGLAKFNEHLLAFDHSIKTLRLEMQQMILPLVLKAAKKIVAKELETHPETIVDIVMQTLLPVTQNKRITIYVNKADKEILDAQKSRIKEILDQVESLSIHERADITPGGCIIETEAGIINASIENQWRALEAAFEKFIKR